MGFRIPDWLRFELAEKWERLTARVPIAWTTTRKSINVNPRVVVGITIASLAVLLLIVIWLLIPGERTLEYEEPEKAWFYDLNTDKLFVAKSNLVAPIEAPSGPLPDGRPAGVKAYVFSYAAEPNESNRFIGFLETSDPNAPATASGSEEWGEGMLIRRLEDKAWAPANSKKGLAIVKEAYQANENGESPSYCSPE